MKKQLLLVLMVLTIFSSFAYAELSCEVITTCSSGYADILHMSNYTNAQAELANGTDYNYKACCKDSGIWSYTVNSSCDGGTEVLHLSNWTNAHVEKATLANYTFNACLYSPNATFVCGYQAGNCNGWETCIAAISNDSNAHIANCTPDPDYNIHVCCNISYNIDLDWDNDGTLDSADTLEGTGSTLNTDLAVTILVDGTQQDSPSGTKEVQFKHEGTTFVKFDYDFDGDEMQTQNIMVNRSATGRGSVLVKGLAGISKTLNVPKVIGSNMVCVKNAEVSSVAEITGACTGDNETFFDNCGSAGQTIGEITCTRIGDIYEITNLTHSAAIESSTSRLEIWSEGTYWQLDTINFYANYTNLSSGAAITAADCDIWFEDTGWDNMTFSDSLHRYNTTFTGAGHRDYNVSCTHATYTNLTINDSFTITSSAIPEFSAVTMMLAVSIILGGLIIIKRRKN